MVGVGCGLDSAYERGGEARRKFRIQPLKENDLGVAQAFLTPFFFFFFFFFNNIILY